MKKTSKFMLTLLAAVVLLAGCTKKSSEKQILSFSFYSPAVEATVMESAKTIVATLPAETDLTALVPVITVSDKATINPASGVRQDFTNPVTYTVTAEDGSQASYTVALTVEDNGGGNGGGGNGGDSHEYVDLGLPSGTLWATCNVGATKPEEYGDYFAWGETQPKDVYNWNTYQYCNGGYNLLTKYCSKSEYGYNGFIDNLTVLQSGDDAATVNWGSGWRTPTKEQWQELIDNTTSAWTTQNDVYGRVFYGNGQSFFLPAAGCRWNDEFYEAGKGYYWSSSLGTDDHPDLAWYFVFESTYCAIHDSHSSRDCGLPVRAVRSARQN